MTRTDQARRLAVKTPEGAYLQILEKGFGFAPRVAQAILATAKEALGGVSAEEVSPGQIRMVVASLKAPFGPLLEEIDKVEVTLTVDAGAEDEQVRQEQGLAAQRKGRIVRILDEALEQGGVLTQEDLGRALGVSSRTIRRDVKTLKDDGHLVHTRGQLKGVGRGQTHKVKIIELWLDREGYDKISRWVHHSPQAIKRYVSTFKRIVWLHRDGASEQEIAFLTKTSQRMVKDYLALYANLSQQPARMMKLEEELARIRGIEAPEEKKGGQKR